MRQAHELQAGIVCERCLTVSQKGNYKRIRVEAPITECTTGSSRTVYRINLCDNCYKIYCEFVKEFLGKEDLTDKTQIRRIKYV